MVITTYARFEFGENLLYADPPPARAMSGFSFRMHTWAHMRHTRVIACDNANLRERLTRGVILFTHCNMNNDAARFV